MQNSELLKSPSPAWERVALHGLLEQGFGRMVKAAFGGNRAVGATQVKVIHGGQRGKLAVARAVTTAMMQRYASPGGAARPPRLKSVLAGSSNIRPNFR